MKRYLKSFTAITVYFGLLSGVCQAFSQEVVCSDGWIRNGSSCYYVYADTSKRLSFWNAKKWCKDHESASLTTVFNEDENHFLDYLINKTHLRPNETFYIGLRFRDSSWKWVTNQPFNYTNWFRGQEPAPAQGTGNCIYYNHVHRWQLEEKCVTKKLFICKTQPKQPQSQPTGSVSNTKQESTSTPSLSTPERKPSFNQTIEKLNKLLSSLEGVSLTDESAEKQMKELGTFLDNLLDSNQAKPESQSIAQLSTVVEMSEKIGELIVKGLKRGGNATEPKSVQIQTSNLALGVDILPPVASQNRTESVSFPQDSKTNDKIRLPASLMWRAQQSDGVSITSLLLPNVSASADPQAKRVLSSGIISSTILFNNGSKFNNLSEPVVINLSEVNKAKAKGSRICVFLDVTTDPPSWSSNGCVVHHHNASRTQCHCYHMTSFAVLMDVHGAYESDAISDDHKLALTTISIVGCLVAFVCYILLLCTLYFLRGSEAGVHSVHVLIQTSLVSIRRTETSSIHMNLAAAESLAIFFFLIAYLAVRIKEACFAIAVLLYYFQLASFCWMLVEGMNLLRGLVKVFRVTSRLRIYCLFAWGLPALFVALIPSIFRHQYLRDNFCWLSHELIWVFAGPVACILAVNLTVLLVAIKIVVRRARYKVKPGENTRMSDLQVEIRAAFKTTVILVPLLGVTWLLGFISIHDKSLTFQYLFAVVNSTQGIYFLIAQYYFDDDIKKNARRASTRMKRLFSFSSAKSTRSSSERRPRTSIDKKPGTTMKHNLVSPQQGNRDQDPVGSPERAAKQQDNDANFGVPQEQVVDRKNKDGSEVARRSSAALNHEGISVCPQESEACDDGKEKKLLSEQESSADQQVDEDKFDGLPRQRSANQEDTGEEQDGIEKDLVSSRQMPSGQQGDFKNWVSPSNKAVDRLGFCSIVNESEDKTKPNCSSSQEKYKDQQDGEENLAPPCLNNEDQLLRIDTGGNLVSPQKTNLDDDQLHAENELNDTRF